DPRLLPRQRAPGRAGQGLARGRDRSGPGSASGLGPPPQARRGRGGPGGAPRAAIAGPPGPARMPPGDAGVLREPGAPDGLSGLPGARLADRLGAGRGGVQDGDRPPAEGDGDALGPGGRRRDGPPARAVRRRAGTMGRLLVVARTCGLKITTYVEPTPFRTV